MSKMRWAAGVVVAAAVAMAAGVAHADDPDPRDWVPAPPGTKALGVYLGAQDSHGFYTNGNKDDAGESLNVRLAVLRPMIFLPFFNTNMIFQPEVILPMGRIGFNMPGYSEHSSGLFDLQAGAALWFVNNEEKQFWMGYEPFLVAPTGTYDAAKATSLGANRWATLQDLAIVKGFGSGANQWIFEGTVELGIYGSNNDVLGEDGQRVTGQQRPTYRFVLEASRNITEATYVGLRYHYVTGGRATVGGAFDPDSGMSDHQLAANITTFFKDHYQLQLQYLYDLRVKNGPAMNGAILRFFYVF
ncbi:MAG TPA: transporter [Nevskiaceae bacterium]